MGESLRVRTKIGINQTINVELTQDFDFLEILSVKLQQSDIYTRSCSQYGVIVGRVTANNGLGIPNARVSVFIPIDSIDESNPIIQSIYPYKSPTDKNEDGYRYNLLPYEKSYSTHAATGTFPSKSDILTGTTALEIYEKYYKYTVKTNDSGDYMIMGAPLGQQTLVMDVDLSDMGEFSLTPQDLIRMGLATENQVSGNRFRTSNDLNSLPQIISITKTVEVSPLWGDQEICLTSINRVDFDLRDDANVDIQPTAVFMGSIFSSADKFRVRKNCRPRDNLGNMCDLTTGPGQILAIRQTTGQDINGNPVLEQYQVENSGNVIDADGTWLLELPMNLDYIVTNEFGEKAVSNDPTVGVPTKSKYRFKIKWQQPNTLNIQTRRGYFLVPNVKEYGWNSTDIDPNSLQPTNPANSAIINEFKSSYYFGLEWSGYTNGFSGQEKIDRLNEVINCEDTFYEFKYNKVYTVAGLIDQYKKGGRARFIGIKEIDDDDCNSTSNKFPVNEGFKNFDALYFLFSILFGALQPIGYAFIVILNVISFIYTIIKLLICGICSLPLIRKLNFCKKTNCDKITLTVQLPMIEYPSCTACDCKQEFSTEGQEDFGGTSGALTYLSSPILYYSSIETMLVEQYPNSDNTQIASAISEALSGNQSTKSLNTVYKIPKSNVYNIVEDGVTQEDPPTKQIMYLSKDLTLGERVNVFNGRYNYFTGLNKIKVKFAKEQNIGSDKNHYDNTLTLLSSSQYNAGDLLTFVNPENSKDLNYLFSAETNEQIVKGITGTTNNITNINVTYATSQLSDTTVTYSIPYKGTVERTAFAQDVEYFQVITAITISDASKIWNSTTTQAIPDILTKKTTVYPLVNISNVWVDANSLIINSQALKTYQINPIEMFENFEDQYIVILQRGVDPYSPKYVNEYGVGAIFGSTTDDPKFTFTAETRVNIPIQKLSTTTTYVQQFNNQNDIYYNSYFFTPGSEYSAFTSNLLGYYGATDATNEPISYYFSGSQGKIFSRTDNMFYSLFGNESNKYDLSEELSSGAILYGSSIYNMIYYSKSLYSFFSANPMSISNKFKNVMRSDRLPTSDALDGGSWNTNPSILQQNNNFRIYQINTDSLGNSIVSSVGVDTVAPDIEGLPGALNVLESFSCQKMVGLSCYQGFSDSFSINEKCAKKDNIENGCYVFGNKPIFGIFIDLQNYSQWAYRFRFMYGICRGVLSQTFTNNWINGTLFAFPIQVDTYFDKKNKPKAPIFCKDLIVFDEKTNNFYYRSSPYNKQQNKFVGRPAQSSTSLNKNNLLYPTTIVNLGYKDSFYSEIIYESETKDYIMNYLEPTSFGDTSDLVNLFVVSRMANEGFLSTLAKSMFGDPTDELFTRENNGLFRNARRVDADFAQLASINSEIGVVKFSPEYYNSTGFGDDPVKIAGGKKNPVMCVFFDSTIDDLQIKDYVTPGRIVYRDENNLKSVFCDFEISSQETPFYQWQLNNNSSNIIFGSQYNNWQTERKSIFKRNYQKLDRTQFAPPTYFIGPNISYDPATNFYTNDTFARGYIFRADNDGAYNLNTYPGMETKFLVGAPFHFYFGVRKGASSLDKFKTKYSISE